MDTSKAPDIVVGCFQAVRQHDVYLLRNIGVNFEPREFKVPDEGLPYKRNRDSDGTPLFSSPGITSVVVRDFDEDGYRDVVGTGWCSDVIVYFPGSEKTYLAPPRLIDAPGGPRDLQAADFNKDGKLDLATAMYSSGEIVLWAGDGKGWFEPRARFSSRGRLPHKIGVADVNRDEKPDIVVSHCYTDDSIVVFYGEGDFNFSVSQEILLGKNRDVLEAEIRDIRVEDLDGNGRVDVAAACYGSKEVVVLFNVSGDSNVPQQFRRETYSYDDSKPRALCVTDLDGDGAKDLAVALWQTNSVAFLLGSPPAGAKAEKESASRAKADDEKKLKPEKAPSPPKNEAKKDTASKKGGSTGDP